MKRPLVAVAIAMTVLGIGGVALAKTYQFKSNPVGEFEVPVAISTDAEGILKLKIDTDTRSAQYRLEITEPIDDVFMAHLHMAPAGVNGPIVVWLYPHPDGPGVPIPGSFEGTLASGVITVDDLRGPLAGNWKGFVQATIAGQLYVNVHTAANPGGEIRDQVCAQCA
jgi:hypothetical protein